MRLTKKAIAATGASLGISAAAVLTLLASNIPAIDIEFALCMFAISLPALSLSALLELKDDDSVTNRATGVLSTAAFFIGQLATVAGLTACFLAVSQLPAILFLLTSIFCCAAAGFVAPAATSEKK